MSSVLDSRVSAWLSQDRALTPLRVREAAELACLLEVSAPKPGNVSPGRPFRDLRYEDFLASAVAIGEPMAGAASRGVGATIRLAIEATTRVTRSNSNLGIVLLFAPLARAGSDPNVGSDPSRGSDPMSRGVSGCETPERGQTPIEGLTLQDRLRGVLESTTVADARDVYAAIRLSRPGGLGAAQSQDVHEEPTATLLEAMRLAAHRDTIAREYATGFDVTFRLAAPTLARARADGLPWDDAVVETFLTVLAAIPDTHIARRSGFARADQVSERARAVLAGGGVRSAAGRAAVDALDASLRDDRNSGNPGTTADLTAAAIFVMLLGGGFNAATQ